MRVTVELPKMGETSTDAVVLAWLVDVGTVVEHGQGLLQVETDKVNAEVPSPVSGVLVERIVDVDSDVTVGDALAVIETVLGERAARG